MNLYTRLTIKAREEISRMLASSQSLRFIAKELKRQTVPFLQDINCEKNQQVYSHNFIFSF